MKQKKWAKTLEKTYKVEKQTENKVKNVKTTFESVKKDENLKFYSSLKI